ncbi:sigma-E processing peptidase SpoIIGA [Natronospora cellulosivora (SeqCode)]
MIVYADITFINNFLMTFAIIWAVAKILDFDYTMFRLTLAALIASIYLFIVIILQTVSFASILYFLINIVLNLVLSIVIIKVGFIGLSLKQTFKAILYLYMVSFITIGTTIAFFYLIGTTPYRPRIQLLALAIFIIFIIANFGWFLFQKYRKVDEYFLPVKIYFQEKKVELLGLLDTGNSLIDPLSQVPVIIVNKENFVTLFPEVIQKELLSKDDYMECIDLFNEFDYGSRLRIIPFSDLGKEHGILIGFRPDYIELIYNSESLKTQKCIIALSKRRLDISNEYQALVHPKLIKAV